MRVNPPRRVRVALYVANIIGGPLVGYLQAKGVLGPLEVSLWSAEVAAVMAMAGLNTGQPDAD